MITLLETVAWVIGPGPALPPVDNFYILNVWSACVANTAVLRCTCRTRFMLCAYAYTCVYNSHACMLTQSYVCPKPGKLADGPSKPWGVQGNLFFRLSPCSSQDLVRLQTGPPPHFPPPRTPECRAYGGHLWFIPQPSLFCV